MTETRLMFSSPHLSKAELADLFERVVVPNKRVDVRRGADGSELSSDPSTVALIAAAGTTVSALIAAVVQVYLDYKRRKNERSAANMNPRAPSVLIKISGTVGESWTISVANPESITLQLSVLPTDPDEIRHIRLE